MTVIELKEKLIAKISTTDNEELLDHIGDIIKLESSDSIYKMSPEEIDAVKDGIAQIENGQFFTNEEANKLINKCLENSLSTRALKEWVSILEYWTNRNNHPPIVYTRSVI